MVKKPIYCIAIMLLLASNVNAATPPVAEPTAVPVPTVPAPPAGSTPAVRYKYYQDFIDISRKMQVDVSLEDYKDQVDVYGDRAYKKEDGSKFPWQLKCSKVDYRTFHFCIEPRFFDPSARIYFDTGKDDADEVDIFNDGNINFALDFVSLYLPWRLGRSSSYDDWSWGPMAGIGIGSAASDSEDNTKESSGAPIVLFSLGAMIEYKISKEGASFGIEGGRAIGVSTDESFGDRKDSATYVGVKINIPFGEKKEPAMK